MPIAGDKVRRSLATTRTLPPKKNGEPKNIATKFIASSTSNEPEPGPIYRRTKRYVASPKQKAITAAATRNGFGCALRTAMAIAAGQNANPDPKDKDDSKLRKIPTARRRQVALVSDGKRRAST